MPDRLLESVGLLTVLTALAVFLTTNYSLIAWSDPATWYAFGRDFTSEFASRGLAYGFPLYLFGSIAAVGPFYAFLANIPLLLVVAALVYGFGRRHDPGGRDVANLTGAVSVALWIGLNPQMLLLLTNPYRDVLAHVLALLAILLFIDFHRGRRSAWRVAASGACLAFACSARETSLLTMVPFFTYAVATKLEDRSLALWRPFTMFAGAFALASVPLLVQNYLVSGDPFLPAQAAGDFAVTGDRVPGFSPAEFATTFPLQLHFLGEHYGFTVASLMAVGLAASLRYHIRVALYISVPALITYGLFYGLITFPGFNRVAPRYLFALDFFALPLAAVGVASLASVALGAMRDSPARWRAWRGVVSLAFLAGALAPFAASRGGPPRLRLEHARLLRDDLLTLIPPKSTIIGDRIATGLASCFVGDRYNVELSLRSEEARDRVAGFGAVVSLTHDPAIRRFLSSKFDLRPLGEFSGRRHGLRLSVDRLAPWSQLESSTRLRPEGPGPWILTVDVGFLSQDERAFAEVSLDDTPIDASPGDRVNFYWLSVEEGVGEIRVRLLSDRPVASDLPARLLPASAPLRLDFDKSMTTAHLPRFHDLTFVGRYQRFAAIKGRTLVDIPTLAPEGRVFHVRAWLGSTAERAGERFDVTVAGAGETLYSGSIVSRDPRGRPESVSYPIAFELDGHAVSGRNTRLSWQVEEPPVSAGPQPTLYLLAIEVERMAP
jgi:hypothetical protein